MFRKNKKKCIHEYKPIDFIQVVQDDYGQCIYIYKLQCMKCGKKPLFKLLRAKNKLELHIPYEINKLYEKE